MCIRDSAHTHTHTHTHTQTLCSWQGSLWIILTIWSMSIVPSTTSSHQNWKNAKSQVINQNVFLRTHLMVTTEISIYMYMFMCMSHHVVGWYMNITDLLDVVDSDGIHNINSIWQWDCLPNVGLFFVGSWTTELTSVPWQAEGHITIVCPLLCGC